MHVCVHLICFTLIVIDSAFVVTFFLKILFTQKQLSVYLIMKHLMQENNRFYKTCTAQNVKTKPVIQNWVMNTFRMKYPIAFKRQVLCKTM